MEEIVFVGAGQTIEEPAPKLLNLLGTSLSLAKSRGHLHSIHIEASQRGLIVVVLLAVQAAQLSLRRLSFFPHGGSCTETIDTYRKTNLEALAPCLENVTESSWSLTTDPKQVADEAERSETEGAQNIAAIRQVLGMVSRVEKLDLLWFKTAPRREPEAHFFEACTESLLAMSRLEECSIRGIFATQHGLQEFLEHTLATKITLRAIHLSEGNYRPMLSVITSGKFR